MSTKFSAGDEVYYIPDGESEFAFAGVVKKFCKLRNSGKREAKAIYKDRIDEYVVVYSNKQGWDWAKSVRKLTKLERALQ